MGVLRVERPAASGLAARTSGIAWRDYDIQLTIYATLLAAMGLAMAYSNTTAQLGEALVAGTTFARGLVWAGLALVVYALATLFDYRWLRTLTWPIYLVNLVLLGATLALGDTDAASARWITILGFQFQFSELAKIVMIVVLARYLADRERRLDSLTSILGACLVVAPPWILVLLQPDLGTSLVFALVLLRSYFYSLDIIQTDAEKSLQNLASARATVLDRELRSVEAVTTTFASFLENARLDAGTLDNLIRRNVQEHKEIFEAFKLKNSRMVRGLVENHVMSFGRIVVESLRSISPSESDYPAFPR